MVRACQWYTRLSDRQSGVCSSCLPTPRLSALRAAAPLHNDGQRWLLADATQHSLYGACRRYTRLTAVWAVVADVHKTLCAVLADTAQQVADATQEPDFDVSLYAVVSTILNGCERDAHHVYYAVPKRKDTAF